MTIRRRRLWFVLIAGVVVAWGLCMVFGKSPYVTESQIARIKPGMTLAEIEQILGPPAVCSSWIERRWETWTGYYDAATFVIGEEKVTYADKHDVDLLSLWKGRICRKFGW